MQPACVLPTCPPTRPSLHRLPRSCADESIDEIAAFLGVGEQVAALTAQAMGGSVLFQDALASRLGVMHPSRENLESFLAGHPPKVVSVCR